MEKINKLIKKMVTVLTIVSITVLWFLGMCYTIQHTVFNH